MGVGEGGPEIVKQLLKNTYDIASPQVVLVYLTGSPAQGVGPHDVAIALCGAVYKNGFVKNKVLEFAGPGIAGLPMDYRIGIDVMTTETACLSSIWETDGAVEEYLAIHGRPEAYEALHPQEGAYYDSMITIDLSKVEPMAALPFHPAEAYPIRELMANPGDIFREVEKRAAEQFGGKVNLSLTDKLVDGKVVVDQGIIAGCAGGMYDNIAEAAAILDGHDVGSGYFSLSIYPPSVPVNLELIQNGVQQSLLQAGALFKPCFCGPCFGAGDVPANNGLSIRHTTRNFPNREGSKPGDGQLSGVVLMDARSIAATARNHGVLTPATEVDYVPPKQGKRTFDTQVYDRRVYFGFGHPQPEAELKFGPNIAEWPPIPALADNLLMQVASVLRDPVTTTDELIPSGETSSYRSNPMKLASFALSRRDPDYVPRALDTKALETARQAGSLPAQVQEVLEKLGQGSLAPAAFQIGSVIFANKPGDGSAREQAASCQRVLGGCANICYEFATKRYRSNCVNWGMLPFTLAEGDAFTCQPGDFIYVPDVKAKVLAGDDTFPALALSGGAVTPVRLILVGVAVSAMFQAFTNYLVYTAPDDAAVREATFWMLGGLGSAKWEDLPLLALILPPLFLVLMALARPLNAMLMGDSSAVTLGVDLDRVRGVLILSSALLTASAVAVSGCIGFVGLVIPHLVRSVVGADHRRLIPLSALCGAVFMIWMDVGARLAVRPEEIPVGIITAFIGAPLFLWMIRVRRYEF